MRAVAAYGPLRQSKEKPMGTAFGIALFVLTYGTVAFMVYDEVSGRRSRRRALGARRSRLRHRRLLRGAGAVDEVGAS
jgi:hypothetical protein